MRVVGWATTRDQPSGHPALDQARADKTRVHRLALNAARLHTIRKARMNAPVDVRKLGAGGACRPADPPTRRVRRIRGAKGQVQPPPKDARDVEIRLKAFDLRERRLKRRRGGQIRGCGYIGRAVLEYVLRAQLKTGKALDEVSYERMALIVGHARSAVVRAMARLKLFGWIDWYRRWELSEKRGRVEQVCNLFWACVPETALQAMGLRIGPAPPPDDDARRRAVAQQLRDLADAREGRLGSALDRLGDLVDARTASIPKPQETP
jgi:hypothetical protein